MLSIFSKISKLKPEEREPYNRMNTHFNSRATLYLSLMCTALLSGSMLIGYLSHMGGATGVDEFWIILPYHITAAVLSSMVFIAMKVIQKKKMTRHIATDILSVFQICLIMTLFLISSHVEIPVIGIKNINVFIIAMFALTFILRLNITITLTLEILFTAAAVSFLLYEKNEISNFYPSLINILCSFVVSLYAAFMYYNARADSYIAARKLENLASSDHLTRLHNRRSFDAYIESEWQRAYNEQQSIALLFIDVDHFKRYNDLYGHLEGDQCLCAVAEILSKSIRKSDFAARYGGEEFVVEMTGANIQSAQRVADNILSAIRIKHIPHSDSVVPYVSLSIGCMICIPSSSDSAQMADFIKQADCALYMAKEQGRNRIVFHPETQYI
jgi:diguanylate cyclase (GGDEF)-like protein